MGNCCFRNPRKVNNDNNFKILKSDTIKLDEITHKSRKIITVNKKFCQKSSLQNSKKSIFEKNKRDYQNNSENINSNYLSKYMFEESISQFNNLNSENSLMKSKIFPNEKNSLVKENPRNRFKSSQGKSYLENDNKNELNVDKLKLDDLENLNKREIYENVELERNISDDIKFTEKILNEINTARIDPLEYSKILEKFFGDIIEDKKIENVENNQEKKYYLLSKGKRLNLDCDKSKFIECANFLKNSQKEECIKSNIDDINKYMKEQELKKLELIEDIKLPLTNLDKKCCTEIDFLMKKLENLKQRFKGKYNINKFSFFKSSTCPKAAIAIQIVNDFSKEDFKKDLLNAEYKYIGLNYKIDNDGYLGIFLTFA